MPTLLEVGVSLIVSFILSEVLSYDRRQWSAHHRLRCVCVILCLVFVVCVCAFGRQNQILIHPGWIIEMLTFESVETLHFATTTYLPFSVCYLYARYVATPALLMSIFWGSIYLWHWAHKSLPVDHRLKRTHNSMWTQCCTRSTTQKVGLVIVTLLVFILLQVIGKLSPVLVILEYGSAIAMALGFIFVDIRVLLGCHTNNNHFMAQLAEFIVESADIARQFWLLAPMSAIVCSAVLVLVLPPLARVMAGVWTGVSATLNRQWSLDPVYMHECLRYVASRGAMFGPFVGLHSVLKRRLTLRNRRAILSLKRCIRYAGVDRLV